MDPNLWHLDWARTLEVVVGVIVLAFLVERVTALIVESRLFVRNTKVPDPASEEGAREARRLADAYAILQLAREIIPPGAADEAEAQTAAQKRAEKKLAELLTALPPSHPLWPPPAGGDHVAQEAAERAEHYLAELAELRARRNRLSRWPLKEVLAFVVAAWVCVATQFDAWAIIMLTPQTSFWGAVLTGAVVAGGSKASIKLFHDLLGVRSMALQEARNDPKAPRREPAP